MQTHTRRVIQTVSFVLLLHVRVDPAPAARTLSVPRISIQAESFEGHEPAAGISIELLTKSGKHAEMQPLASARTGADGRTEFPAFEVSGVQFLCLRFAWEERDRPTRAVLHQVRAKKGQKSAAGYGVELGKSTTFYVMEDVLGGDCGNLVSLSVSGEGIAASFRRPGSYLACNDPQFKFPDLTSIGNRSINQGKLNIYSMDDDMQMGREFFDQLSKTPEQPLLEDQLVQGYVQGLVDRLASFSDSPQLDFHVRMIDADVLNAFALPGGYVFVYRGLIDATENESELVGVLAHEIAHVTSRHGTEGVTSAIGKVLLAMAAGELLAEELTDSEGSRELIKGLVLGGTQFWIMGGTRKREAEADHLGAQYAWKAGYDPLGLASFFQKLAKERDHRQTRLDQLFSDHPNDEARVRNVTRIVDYFLPEREDQILSTPEYVAVKERLGQLPPAKVSGEAAANALFSSFQAANEGLILDAVMGYLEAEAGGAEQEGATE